MLDRPLPSLAAIRAFEAAARLGSFMRASRELGTSSASVSYHIRRLETDMGLQLFVRLPHSVKLTEAGSMIAGEASRAFDALRATFCRASQIDEGRLSLTVLPTFGTTWLAPKLGLFRNRHPEFHVALSVSSEPEDLSGGRFDAAVRNGDGNWPGLRTTQLFPSIFMPLCAPALLGEAASLGRPGAESDVPLLGRTDWWTAWYKALGRDWAPTPSRVGTTLAAEHLDVAAALGGHGIVIASPILFHDEIRAGRLVPAHHLVASAGRSFWLAYPVSRHSSPKITALRDWILDEAQTARDAARHWIDTSMRCS